MTAITLADIQAKQKELESMIAKFKKQTNKPYLEINDDVDAIRIITDSSCGVILYKDDGRLYINKPEFERSGENASHYIFTLGGRSD